MKQEQRSLYQCGQAKVKNNHIYCAAGHSLNKSSKAGEIKTERLALGHELVLGVCQGCTDYIEIGCPLSAEDRGWIK